MIKKVKKSFDPSGFSFTEIEFTSKESEQKVPINIDFLNQLCATRGLHVLSLNDSKLGNNQ